MPENETDWEQFETDRRERQREAAEKQEDRATNQVSDQEVREWLGIDPLPEDRATDQVNHPRHYNSHPSGLECIEVVRHHNFNVGNVIKYLWRAGLKDGEADLKDLKKALWYLQDEILRVEGEK
jgi:hypothetical protein